jgi:BTB/POZ domain
MRVGTMRFAHDLNTYSSLAALRTDGEFVDVHLRTHDGCIPAHRVVLAAHSSFFRTKLKQDWKGTSPEVDLQHLQSSILHTIIEAIYTGSLDVHSDNAIEVFAAASELDIPSILDTASQVRIRSHAMEMHK